MDVEVRLRAIQQKVENPLSHPGRLLVVRDLRPRHRILGLRGRKPRGLANAFPSGGLSNAYRADSIDPAQLDPEFLDSFTH